MKLATKQSKKQAKVFSRKIHRPGFTLIELLVVIAIIGLLATIAVIALNQARQNSRDSKRIGDIKQINTALQLYYSKSPDFKYPASVEDLTTPITGYVYDSSCAGNSHNDDFIDGLKNLNPEIMPNRPDEPQDSRLSNQGQGCYLYIVSNDYKHYYLMTLLEDTSKSQRCNLPTGAPGQLMTLNGVAGRYCFQSDYFE